MVFEDSLMFNLVACLILTSLWASENGQNLLAKMASEGVKESDARISNRRAMKNVCLLFLSITGPNLSMMLVWAYSVDPLPLTVLTFCPVFSDNHSWKSSWSRNRVLRSNYCQNQLILCSSIYIEVACSLLDSELRFSVFSFPLWIEF